MNAIILHGMPSRQTYYDPTKDNQSDSHWLPWLQRQLMLKDIYAAAPEMPLSFDPQYDIWQKEFERYDITPETILVGHSCGGGFLVRWLSEHKDVMVGKVVLVAPWIDPAKDQKRGFFDFEIDPELASRTAGITIFNSTNDDETIHKSIEILRDKIKNISHKEFVNYGHFCFNDMHTREFPELLAAVL